MPCCDPVGDSFDRYYAKQGRKAIKLLCDMMKVNAIDIEKLDLEVSKMFLEWTKEHLKFDKMTEHEKMNYVTDKRRRR